MNVGNIREIDYKSVVIDGREYQAPSPVIRALETLKQDVEKERKDHQKTKEYVASVEQKNYPILVSRILINLAYGVPKIDKLPGLNKGEIKFDKNESCLAYSLDEYETINGNTVHTFKIECERRIIQALRGYSVKGNKFKDAR